MIEKQALFNKTISSNLRFTSSCRNALYQILAFEEHKGFDAVLLPSYVGLSLEEGSGILDPVTQTGKNYVFYKLDENLDPDLADLGAKILLYPKSIVLFVNYFGWKISNRDELLALCQKARIKAIEDNAHVLSDLIADQNIDSDYQIFSIHKFLGTKNGGAIKSKNPMTSITNTISEFDLVDYATSPVRNVLQKRMKNFEYLNDKINEMKGKNFEVMFTSTPSTALNFPILMKNKGERHSLYLKLIKNEITPTALYHRLVPQINSADFPISCDISDRILNLPLHQDVHIELLEFMCAILSSDA